MTSERNFADRLLESMERKESAAVIGLDPRLEWIPSSIRKAATRARGEGPAGTAEALRRFCQEVVDLVEPYAAAVKIQIAFFEEYGGEGLSAYGDVARHARGRGLVVIGDAKRADISTTAKAYARAHLGASAEAEEESQPQHPIRVDALTVNPYLGSDGVEPFLEPVGREGKGIFVLCRTSNPSAGEFQDLEAGGSDGKRAPLHEVVAQAITRWGETHIGDRGYSSVGAVVGLARDRSLLSRIRALLPRAIILVPGFGAQGGGEEDLPALFNADGSGAIVNSSRGVIFAYRREGGGEEKWQEAVTAAARELRDGVNRARRT